MGVKGLWHLVAPTSKTVNLQELQKHVLAIDFSIWLHQISRFHSQSSPDGSSKFPLKILYYRLLKLIFYGIKAVFVFDGPGVSSLKNKTRHLRRLKKSQDFFKSQKLHSILIKYLAAKLANQSENDAEAQEKPSVSINEKPSVDEFIKDRFELYDETFVENSKILEKEEEEDEAEEMRLNTAESVSCQNQILYCIDKLSAKCSVLDFPEDSGEFSAFQMRGLLMRSELGQTISQLRSKMILRDPTIAKALQQGQSIGDLFDLKKLFSRDNRHHLLFEKSKVVKEESLEANVDRLLLNVESNPSSSLLDDVSPHEMTAQKDDLLTIDETSDSYDHSDLSLQHSTVNFEQQIQAEEHLLPRSSTVADSIANNCPVLKKDDSPQKKTAEIDSEDDDDFIEVEDLPENRFLSFINDDSAKLVASEPAQEVTCSSAESESEEDVDDELLRKQKSKLESSENSAYSQLLSEAETLIRCFGMPIVKGAGEAEAQCAWLESAGLTTGTITDDSDIWLFGGQRVYKNVFAPSKDVEEYDIKRIADTFGLSREQLILFAMLVGCDYTAGVENVGTVKAMEVLAEFQSPQPLDTLRRFRSSAEKSVDKDNTQKSGQFQFANSFPDPLVYEAFTRPALNHPDSSALHWTLPDVDKIRRLMLNWFGWSADLTDKQLLPAVKRLSASTRGGKQSTLFQHFERQSANSAPFTSGRLQKAVTKLKDSQSVAALVNNPPNAKQTSKRPRRGGFLPAHVDWPEEKRQRTTS